MLVFLWLSALIAARSDPVLPKQQQNKKKVKCLAVTNSKLLLENPLKLNDEIGQIGLEMKQH